MKRTLLLCLTLGAVLLPSVVMAQTDPAPKTKTIIFGEDEVTTTLKKPGGEAIVGEHHDRLGSLIKVRKDFNDKVVQSINDLD